jgi:hypothetical protein
MPYDKLNELKRVTDYYAGDALQKRFSAIISGETNSGKTYLLRTARMPVHIDSFDPGGSKCLQPWIDRGQIVVDTTWENEDPFEPKAFAEWKKTTEIRFKVGYYEMFGTYCIDGLTTFSEAVMNDQLAGKDRAGETPMRNRDYMPQKTQVVNYVRKLMNLPCDFILTGHLREIVEKETFDAKTGISQKILKYRLHTTGQAVVTIPLLFDELYVIQGKGVDPKRELLIDSLGQYIARSRLKKDGKLNAIEKPDIKELLKKSGLSWEDKPKLER